MDSPSSSPDLVEPRTRNLNAPASSNRILYHVPCKVCNDHSSGKHYGIFACDGCAGFFKRSIRCSRRYVCKTNPSGKCVVNKKFRNQCRACRLRRCLAVGMNKDAVQHERGPRNSTIQKQMTIFQEAMAVEINYNNNNRMLASNAVRHGFGPYAAPQFALDLSAAQMPRMPHMPTMPRMPHPHQPYVLQPAYPLVVHNVPLSPPRNEVDGIRERAATLLIKNINWIRNNRALIDITSDDQILLLMHSWREFFILALAQTMMPTNFTQLFFVYDSNNRSHELNVQRMRDVQNFQEILNHIMIMNMDANEFDGLRAILLYKKAVDDNMATFSRSNNSQQIQTLHEPLKIIAMYEESRLALINYVSIRHRNQHRYGSIMQLILLLKSISSETIKDMFFSNAIGETSMDQLVINLYCNRNF